MKVLGFIFRCILYFLLAIPLTALLKNLVTGKVETLAATNVFFAVIAALSSICFSWLRAIDEKVVGLKKQILFIGELFLLSALLFLLASGMKYGLLVNENGEMEKSFLFLNPVLRLGSRFAYGFALLFFTSGGVILIDVLTGRFRKRIESLDKPKERIS
jgi:hypothetical protein